MNVNLINQFGWKWDHLSEDGIDIWVKGFFYKDNSFYSSEIVVQYLREIIVRAENLINSEFFSEILLQLNGTFAIVIECKDWFFSCVDRVRSIPLFYGYMNGKFVLSDDALWVKKQVGDYEIDLVNLREFMLTGYVTGPNTLFSSVKQVQAGEFLFLEKNENGDSLKCNRYYRWLHSDCLDFPEEYLLSTLDSLHIKVFERLLETTEGRTIVIPLSGGFDSRLIVTMLKRLGRENVICFSYGRPGNWQAKTSQKVAKELGFPWEFIPSDFHRWKKWYSSQERLGYYQYSSGLSSLPHIQDWPFVWDLKLENKIPDDSIFIPGHTGDFITGGHIPHCYSSISEVTDEQLFIDIWKRHYNLWRMSKPNSHLLSKIGENYTDIDDIPKVLTPSQAAALFEEWEWQERQSKFIINSLRVYDYWNYSWRIPLWDNDIMEYWSRVPLINRINSKLYKKYVDWLFKKFNVDFQKITHCKITGKISSFSEHRFGILSIDDFINVTRLYIKVFPTIKFNNIMRIININKNRMDVYRTVEAIK